MAEQESDEELTEALNRVCAEVDTSLDEFGWAATQPSPRRTTTRTLGRTHGVTIVGKQIGILTPVNGVAAWTHKQQLDVVANERQPAGLETALQSCRAPGNFPRELPKSQ
jgi:hypothetical protein